MLRDHPPASADAAVVKALAGAGMVSVGRTNLSEFAFSGLGINPHYGTALNPVSRDVPRIPGGSSAGSGAAVAAGLVPIAIGTDTGGSIRIPAAFNGIVGYKATRGRYSMQGVFPLAKSLDLARSAVPHSGGCHLDRRCHARTHRAGYRPGRCERSKAGDSGDRGL